MHLAIPTASHNHFSFIAWLHNLTARDVAPIRPGFTRPIATQVIARNKMLEVKQPLGVTIECLDAARVRLIEPALA